MISPCRPEQYLFCYQYINRAFVGKAQIYPKITAKHATEMLEKSETSESVVKQGLNLNNNKNNSHQR